MLRLRDLLLLVTFLGGCASAGSYVWVQDLPAQAAGPAHGYLVRTGDTLSVRVVNQDNLTTHARVRPDGRIAMPLLGDIEVRGKTPSSLRSEIEARLKQYVIAPSVTVNVDQLAPGQITVLGEVQHPGVFPITVGAVGVAQALADAGGLTDYADRSSIFVVRSSDHLRVRFTYNEVSRGNAAALRFNLEPGDVVVVE
jgi:polysaccharide export outer membrane protein